MPYIITTSVYPSDKAMEVAKKYLEVVKKYPPDETLGTMVAVAVKSTEQGLTGISVIEVKEGQLEKALTRSANAMAMFLNIVGYEYSVDVYLTVPEALSTVGMSLPG